ncbi:MAG: TonB-dependent receptor, partial [Calditrichales bacterium]
MQIKKFLFCILVLMSGVQIVFADQIGRIAGRVFDMKTKENLAGVNVLISGTNLGTATDLDGNFLLENLDDGVYLLEFEFVGYITQKVTDVIVVRSKPTHLEVSLKEEIFQSETIAVSAGYFVEEKMTQPSVVGLTREEIRRFPGGFEDVVRTVTTLPGVAVNIAGGRNDLLVRGGGPSENLYVVNNIEVPNINHFGTQGSSSGSLSFINLDFIDNVSFSTGGFSSRYGDKMSSVLNIQMSRGRNDHLGGKFLVSATQYGLNFEGPLGESGNFIFSTRQSYLDLIFKAAGLPFIPIYTDFNFLVQYDLSNRDKLFFMGLIALDRVERDNSSVENQVKNAGVMDNTQNQYITGLNYRRLLDKGYMDVTVSMNSITYAFSQIDDHGEKYFQSDAMETEWNLKFQRYMALSKEVGLLAGVSLRSAGIENTTVFADTIYDRNGNRVPVEAIGVPGKLTVDERGKKYAAFVNASWDALPKLSIEAGLRLDYYSFLKKPEYLAPRINFKYSFSERFSFKGSYGIFYQSPSYVWLSNEENRDLSALKNTMYIAGIDYLVQDDLRMAFEAFYKNYDNLPTGTVAGVNDYLVITNTGTGYGGREDDFQSFGYFPMASSAFGNAYGFEWQLQKKFSEVPCYGQVSLGYVKSIFTAGNGNEYPGQFDQRYILNISGGYKFSDKWEISSKFRYYTGITFTPVYRPSDNPVNPGYTQNLPEEYLSARLDTEGIWDIRVDRYFTFQT